MASAGGYDGRGPWQASFAWSYPVAAGSALFASAWKSDVRSLLAVSGRTANEGKDEEEAVQG
jgi:hypothetical protein